MKCSLQGPLQLSATHFSTVCLQPHLADQKIAFDALGNRNLNMIITFMGCVANYYPLVRDIFTTPSAKAVEGVRSVQGMFEENAHCYHAL